MPIANICACVSCVIAFASVCVSIYAVRQSRKTALTETYFSEMASAYAEFLHCIANFVFRRESPERDALSAALYRVLLFASDEIATSAQQMYVQVIDWVMSGTDRALTLDENLNRLEELMRADLDRFRLRSRH